MMTEKNTTDTRGSIARGHGFRDFVVSGGYDRWSDARINDNDFTPKLPLRRGGKNDAKKLSSADIVSEALSIVGHQ